MQLWDEVIVLGFFAGFLVMYICIFASVVKMYMYFTWCMSAGIMVKSVFIFYDMYFQVFLPYE